MRPRSAEMHSDRFPCDHMKAKAASKELYKPQGCLPLWPEEEAEVYPSHSSAGDVTAVCLQVTRGNAELMWFSILRLALAGFLKPWIKPGGGGWMVWIFWHPNLFESARRLQHLNQFQHVFQRRPEECACSELTGICHQSWTALFGLTSPLTFWPVVKVLVLLLGAHWILGLVVWNVSMPLWNSKWWSVSQPGHSPHRHELKQKSTVTSKLSNNKSFSGCDAGFF